MTTAFDDHGRDVARIGTDLGAVTADTHVHVMAAVVDRKAQCAKRFRPIRRQNKAVTPGFQAGEAALDEVDASSHGGEVNPPLGGGSSLDVATSDLSTCWKNSIARLRLLLASTHVCTTPLNVEPCDVRAM